MTKPVRYKRAAWNVARSVVDAHQAVFTAVHGGRHRELEDACAALSRALAPTAYRVGSTSWASKGRVFFINGETVRAVRARPYAPGFVRITIAGDFCLAGFNARRLHRLGLEMDNRPGVELTVLPDEVLAIERTVRGLARGEPQRSLLFTRELSPAADYAWSARADALLLVLRPVLNASGLNARMAELERMKRGDA